MIGRTDRLPTAESVSRPPLTENHNRAEPTPALTTGDTELNTILVHTEPRIV
jgi:hypothetical protein